MPSSEQSIESLGWDLEEGASSLSLGRAVISVQHGYRASQGHFHTQWRSTPEEVLNDVKLMRQKQAEHQ